MTRLRADLVCENSLRLVADRLGVGDYLKLGHGEELGGGRKRSSILADAVEAIIAAVYLDGGNAEELIHRVILKPAETSGVPVKKDYKTALQELVQKKNGRTLAYETIGESGPDHNKTFEVRVLLNGEPVAYGNGRSKKEAEQDAACHAVEELFNET